MSYYYQYYIGYKQDDKIYPLGPYDAFGKLRPVIEKSRSFASDLYDWFLKVDENQISEELRKQFAYKEWDNTEICKVKYLPIDELPKESSYKKGYFLIDDVQAWETEGDDSLFYHMITPQFYAEKVRNELTFGKNQPKKDIEGNEYTEPNASDYMYYATQDYHCKEYEAEQLRMVADIFYEYGSPKTKEIVILETEG